MGCCKRVCFYLQAGFRILPGKVDFGNVAKVGQCEIELGPNELRRYQAYPFNCPVIQLHTRHIFSNCQV
jgi:hypothetical protein